MLERIRGHYGATIKACYLGYFTQAIVNNYTPLLFLTFVRQWGLSLESITLLTTINFAIQLCVDAAAPLVTARIGYRRAAVLAHVLAAAGLIGLAVLPSLLGSAMAGLMAAVVLYALGGGLLEVLISPIVEACPTDNKEATMSLLHSFYCWGHVGVVLLSTGFFALCGVEHWRALACLWAVIPLVAAALFTQVPIYPVPGDEGKPTYGQLMRSRVFWLLMVIMVCAGASEQAVSQWSSTFAEAGLGLSKTLGDLAGPCAFALLMGLARALYAVWSERIPLKRMMLLSAVMCLGCYAVAALAASPAAGLIGCAACGFSVGIFWPGTFSMAARRLPMGGTAMYALMALAGDLGCSAGPTVVGMAAGAAGGNLKVGLLAAMVFPAMILAGIAMMKTERT